MVFWITLFLTTPPSKGDLNGDGAINAIDVHIAGQMVAGIIPSDKKVDFNKNNRVDIGDVAILRYYVMTGNPPLDYANIPARTSGYETVIIGSYTATTGSRVIVPISIKNVKKVIGFSLDLFYDPNTISVQKVKANNSIITGSNVISNIDNNKGKTRIVLANINTITVSTATPTIDVILRNTGPGKLNLQNVEIVSSNFQLYRPSNIIDGRITIATPKTINRKPITPFKPILIIGIALIAIILILIALSRKSKRKKKITPSSDTKGKQLIAINLKSGFGYSGATIIYKIKLENSTSEPISDIKVYLFVPDVFLLKEKEKTISMLDSGESKTVTFELRPTGECGECKISGRVNYYDYRTKRREEVEIETKAVSIVCPILRIKEISESEWRNAVINLIKAEENTKELEIPAETLFGIATRVIKDLNLFRLEPEITKTPQLFNGVARFYGEGVTELKYAVQVEVIGGSKKSKLILKAFSEKEDALTGFYHKILDELEKRINVKEYIDDSIVQYHITTIKDSVVQRSQIGTGKNDI